MTNETKTWQEIAQADGVWPIFDGATASRFMSQEIAELRAKVESLAADAERYRWLRDFPWHGSGMPVERVISQQRNALWDASIDEAKAKEKA